MNSHDRLGRLVRAVSRFRRTPIVDDDFPVIRDEADAELEAAANHLRASRPTVVCLCGSSRFREAFEASNRAETLAGKIVLSIGMFGHSEGLDMNGTIKAALDQLHFRKIDLADEVLILNCLQPFCNSCQTYYLPREGIVACCSQPIAQKPYLGESTQRELTYAVKNGKVVRFLEAHP